MSITSLAAPANQLAARYHALSRAHQALREDAQRRLVHHHWETLISGLNEILLEQPAPDKALEVRVRYTMGLVWRDSFEATGEQEDLRKAAEDLAAIAEHFASSPLADDALYQLGECYLRMSRIEEARVALQRILEKYPEGNRSDEAQFLLGNILAGENGPGVEGGAHTLSATGEGALVPGTPEVIRKPGPDEPSQSADQAPAAARNAANTGPTVEAGTGENSQENQIVERGAPSPTPPPSELSDIRVWTNPDYTRLAFTLSRGVSFGQSLLKGKGEEGKRIELTLVGATLSEDFESRLDGSGPVRHFPISGGLLDGVSVTREESGALKVSLSVHRIKEFRVTPFLNPYRLLIDLFGVLESPEDDEFDELGQLVLGLPSEEERASRPLTVVIDAGHGGEDPGATGPSGIHEKDVVLAIARKLRKKLSTMSGMRVIMTRDRDVFVPLGRRAKIANNHKADLFMSIHANAAPTSDRRGIETYYLDTATDKGAERLAEKENAMLEERTDLAFILQDLLISGNVRYSRHLAQSVHESVIAALGAKYKKPPIRDLGVKTALFYVLFGAQMPSILIETSFISNKVEEKRLVSASYQDAIAEALVTGIKRYSKEACGPDPVEEE